MSIKEIIQIRILNAVVIAFITFFSSLSVNYPPSVSNVYASLIAFSLTFLVQIKAILNEIEQEYKRKKKVKDITSKNISKMSNLLILL